MKFIIFHDFKTKASTFGYQTSLKMAHLLNVNVACLGIGEYTYNFVEDLKTTDIEFKIKYLLECNVPEFERQSFIDAEKAFNSHKKLKNKSSKQIIAYQVIKRNIETIFDIMLEGQSRTINNMFGLNTFKHLINGDNFYFYETDLPDTAPKNEEPENQLTDILQLLLPDPEKGQPLFFINIENDECANIPEVEIHSPDTENAENRDCFYGEKGFTFPMLTMLSANETALARKQLAEPTKEYREQLERWAEICYANPDTNEGLNFFRKNIQPLLKSSENLALKSQILKNAADYTNQNQQTQIIVGEAPIEKIWKIYRDLETISEETFNELLQIKTSQSPKFEGRWPIVFLKSLPNQTISQTISKIDTVQSVRKVIAID